MVQGSSTFWWISFQRRGPESARGQGSPRWPMRYTPFHVRSQDSCREPALLQTCQLLLSSKWTQRVAELGWARGLDLPECFVRGHICPFMVTINGWGFSTRWLFLKTNHS